MGYSEFTTKQEDLLKATLTEMANRAKIEAGYNATRFLQMLSERGAFNTAKYLLSLPNPSDGFTNMVLAGRLDLTLEWVVQDEPWCFLLEPNDLKVARRRTGPRS